MTIDNTLQPGKDIYNANSQGYFYDQYGRVANDLVYRGEPIITTNLPGINSNNLAPQVDLSTQIIQPAQTPPPIVPPLEATPPLQQTEPEAKAQDLTTRLQELNDKLIGKSTYQAQKEAEAGIPELQKTQTDLTAQVKALANEANQIPLQLQNEAIGRGQTAGGLQPIQTAALRNNAIKSLAVNSLLASSQGNLAYAQSLADKAVVAQYGPIEEEIKAKTANLDLIIKSPDYTRAEKDKAQKQLDFQNQQKEKLDAEKLEKKNIYDIAIEAAKNGADALTLQKIQGATTDLEAAQIAAQTGAIATEKKLDTSVVEIGGRKVLVNNQTGETIKDLGVSNSTNEKPLDILDIQRYKEQYPDAGIEAGDTKTTADAKVSASNSPEAKAKNIITQAKNGGDTYESVVKDIDGNASGLFADKELAKRVAKEVFAVAEQPTSEIEQEIARLKKDGILNDADIRSVLYKRYPKEVVENSSVVSPMTKAINSISSYLFGE